MYARIIALQGFNSENGVHFQRVASPPADVDMCLGLKVVEDTTVSGDTFSVISLCFHIYPSQRHTTDIMFSSRFPPADDSQRWVHAFAFMDTLQQSWAPPREEAPQWLGHPRPLNETGEAKIAVTFNVKEGERERPEAAGAGRQRTERPPAGHCALQNPSWCSTNQFSMTCSVQMVSRCAVPQLSSSCLFVLRSFTPKQHNHPCKEFLTQPGLRASQQSRDRASALAASQGGEIAFKIAPMTLPVKFRYWDSAWITGTTEK